MKRVGIDARLYFQTGVGVYIRNLLHYLQHKKEKNIEFYVYLLKDDIKNVRLSKEFILRPVTSKWHSISEQTIFLKDILRDNLDLMHFTYFSFPILYPKKFIATVHDTTLFHHKTGKASTRNPMFYEIKHFIFRYVFRKQIDKSECIITPTNVVKKDIINLFGKKYLNKIQTIYEGVTYEFNNKKPIQRDDRVHNLKYFLYVGNFFPHKNVERLIKAFSEINSSYKLVLLGPNDYFSDRINRMIQKIKMNRKIIFFKNVRIENLPYYYKNAKAFVHPSLSEGFGLPLIEAYYFGCPILASNIKVFKEILDDNYMSFNPYSVQDIKTKLQKFILNPVLKYEKNEIMKKFSFKSMTDQTYELYNKTLNLSI